MEEEKKESAPANTEEEEKEEKTEVGEDKDNNCLVDSYIGKYKSEKELKIGDREMTELIETCEKNNKKF